MLLERAKSLTTDIGELRGLRQGLNRDESFRTRRDFYRTMRESLEAVLEHLERLEAEKIPVAVIVSGGIRAAVRDLRARVANDADALIAPDQAMRTLLTDNPRSVAEKLNAQLLAAWATYIDEMLPEGNEELLGLLTLIPALQAEMIELDRKWKTILAAKSELPNTAAALRRPAELAGQIRDLMAALKLQGVPDEVRTFLLRLAEGGAAIDDYTDVVRDWCLEHDVVRSLRIRLR